MGGNGRNDFGVEWCRIEFCTRILNSHNNVQDFNRHDDIVYDILREDGIRHQLVCVDEYACGIAVVMTVLEKFSGTDMIFIGGNWNGYTEEAKEYCQESKIGLFNAAELNGSLWFKKYWSYYKKDDEGNPVFQYNNG